VREKLGGEVIVCSMGPQRVKSVIKDALCAGSGSGHFTLWATISLISLHSGGECSAAAHS